MLTHPVGRLRLIAIIEGISFLLLLGVAMPLKYAASMPLAVTIVGWIHGFLFLLFVAALAQAHLVRRWTTQRSAVLFLAALVPFGTFVTDRQLVRELSS